MFPKSVRRKLLTIKSTETKECEVVISEEHEKKKVTGPIELKEWNQGQDTNVHLGLHLSQSWKYVNSQVTSKVGVLMRKVYQLRKLVRRYHLHVKSLAIMIHKKQQPTETVLFNYTKMQSIS